MNPESAALNSHIVGVAPAVPIRSRFAKQKDPSKLRVSSGQSRRAEVVLGGVEAAVEPALLLKTGSATVAVALLRVPHSSFPVSGAGARPV